MFERGAGWDEGEELSVGIGRADVGGGGAGGNGVCGAVRVPWDAFCMWTA